MHALWGPEEGEEPVGGMNSAAAAPLPREADNDACMPEDDSVATWAGGGRRISDLKRGEHSRLSLVMMEAMAIQPARRGVAAALNAEAGEASGVAAEVIALDSGEEEEDVLTAEERRTVEARKHLLGGRLQHSKLSMVLSEALKMQTASARIREERRQRKLSP